MFILSVMVSLISCVVEKIVVFKKENLPIFRDFIDKSQFPVL